MPVALQGEVPGEALEIRQPVQDDNVVRLLRNLAGR